MSDERPLARFRHIAIEGPIGAGKTTLARLLAARAGAELLLEQPGENPFLARFYDDRVGYAFQTQLFFLFQRERQVRALAQPSMFAQTTVSDFMFAKDALFARLNLSDEEYRLYAQMHQPIAAQLREPDLVVRLQASAPTLLARVRRRAIAMEHNIDLGYLQRLGDAYADFFASYDGAPVFVIDTERFHPLEHDGDLAELVRALEGFDGRHGALGAPVDIVFD
ncbi:MAG TPA: deoxynucleoside kinase [Caldimonas sp.]|jgi:deoxyadenosine/deoxycytidine kinase